MNVPKLRFKEFDGEWEEHSLSDIAEFSKGKGISKDSLSTDGKPCILYGELYTKYKEVASSIYSRTNIENHDLVKSRKFDVLIPSSGETAKDIACSTCVIQEDVLIGGDLNILRFVKEIDGRFISYQINGIKKLELSKYAQGTTVVHLYSQGIKKLYLKIPTIEEQKKISELLLLLDKKIQLQQQKIDLLQEQKKGFLQKMFPKAGETQPEMRFDGFAGEWKECKLGEVSNIIGGGTPSTSIEEYWKGNINWYSPVEIGEEIYVYESRKKITETGLKKSSARILPIGTVLFTSRAGIGNTAILAREGCTNQGFQSIVPLKDKLDSYFIFSRTEELKRYAEINGAGSTFVEISGKQMSKMPILLPDLKEQKRIGLFFKRLDDEIILQKRKLNLIQQQKQGFMQQMFI